MERGKTCGEGERLGQSQYHILNTGSQGAGAGFFWHVWGSWNSVHWQTQPHTKRSLALTPFLRWPGSPLPKNLLLEPGRICAIHNGSYNPNQIPHLLL